MISAAMIEAKRKQCVVCLPRIRLQSYTKRSRFVMAAEHESGDENRNRSKVGRVKASTFIFTVTTASVIGGFGLALGRVKKKNPTEFSELAANKLALKALGYGTILSVCGCGLLVLTVKWALGIRNLDDFSIKMKQNLPQKDGEFVQKFDSWKISRKPNANDEEEWKDAMSK